MESKTLIYLVAKVPENILPKALDLYRIRGAATRRSGTAYTHGIKHPKLEYIFLI